MHKPMLHQVVDCNEWITLFEKAMEIRDANQIHILLDVLPFVEDIDVMKHILLLTIDAEIVLCEMHQDFVNKRAAVLAQIV